MTRPPTLHEPHVVKLRSPHGARLRFYRVALAVSLTLNALLVAAFALYLHFEGLLSIVETAVGVFN